MKLDRITIAAVAATIGLGLITAASASAQSILRRDEKKIGHSLKVTNKKVTRALDKSGHAAAYSTRKDADQTSVATHKALDKNSVVRNNKKKKNYIVHPGGTKTPESKYSTAKR